MKTLWTIIATMAVANILALGGVIGWLKATDRLSSERVKQARMIFAKSIHQEQQDKDAADAKVEQARREQMLAVKMAEAPVTAAERITQHQGDDEQKVQAVLRRQQELENLRSALMHQLASLEDREKKLAADRAAFESQMKRFAEIEGAQQFKTALTTLEGQKPKDAKAVLKALLEVRQVEQVVAYLSRMDEGKRSKVMAEFVKDDPTVAADLLERLRTRGILPAQASPRTPANDAKPGSAADNASHPAS